MKKYMIGLITGIVLLSGTCVFAATLLASNISYKNTNVEAALDDLYSKANKKICTLKSGTALTIGSKYECNPNMDGTTKYNFYILKVDTNTVKLIMERNITDIVGNSKTMDWQTAMDFFRNGDGKNLGWKVVVDLPAVQDIVDAVDNDSWKLSENDYNGWFCLATKKQDYSGSPYCGNQRTKNFLYDYTRGCSDWGCSNSLDSSYAYGYWTRDIIIKQLDTTARAWRIIMRGSLYRDVLSSTSNNGVRPVITISKSSL